MARGIATLFLLVCMCLGGAGAVAQHVLEDRGPVVLTDAERTEDALMAAMLQPWTGDLDGMVERGFIRMGVPQEPMTFVYDGAEQRGIAVEFGREFEAHLRKTLGTGAQTLTVSLMPLTRDRMIDALVEGQVDVLAANLTVTTNRSQRVDFADPMLRDVRELVVTGPAAPPVATIDDLTAIPMRIRQSSSYHEHLVALNAARVEAGKPPIPVIAADEALEDYDLAELVNVGVVPAIIVDSHKAELFANIFMNLVVHRDIAVSEGDNIAWAIRKASPQMMAATNAFVAKAHKGTELGNILYRRWIADPTQVVNAIAPGEDAKFVETIGLIRRHATSYDFDPVLIAAQGYQESRLDQSKRSAAGAIGVMQVMPATARDPNVNITDIQLADRNVEAGVKYLRHLRQEYFSDLAISPFDQACFAFAAYNAGPGNIRRARARAESMGLDPNIWFGNVEVAAGRTISREPLVYVRNILKYYTTYKFFEAQQTQAHSADHE
ncbi:transporter substrate-binding domain-containing protein [Paracoccus litorisediminis]|uniref:transglycosylase SLT domain-containing protein n=1 Tax=Paracoccus litorisediminis TaxID=2006130 RepID=UPI003730C054